MNNKTTVCARIDTELKKEVDRILECIGVKPSELIQMLYGQVKLTKSIPFELKLPKKIDKI